MAMPTINRIERKKKSTEVKETDMRELRRKAYNTTAWRKMRDTYMHEHPICEECLKKGKVTPAEDIHHIRSPFKGGEINYGLVLDYDNLMSVCKVCHQAIHNQKAIAAEEIIRQLDALFDENIPDEDL